MSSYPRRAASRPYTRGFSLIEVMVAVVILATGLLALAALQGALARNSADAKARGAVMSAMASRMSEIRQGNLGCTPDVADDPLECELTWDQAVGWVSAAALQAGASKFDVVEKIEVKHWDATASAGVGAFEDVFISNSKASFIRATLTGTWTGADGEKTLVLASDLSDTIYGLGSGYPVPDPDGSASKHPVVRQVNPEGEDGVIPIATSDDPNSLTTAASNPKPLLVGDARVVGTQFDVLSYIPEGDYAQITRRVNTNLVKCKCETGLTSPNRGVAGVAQWPTVWSGAKYETYKPSPAADAPGVTKSAGEDSTATTPRTQSPLCVECCRDHHDNGGTVLFSPEGTATKYRRDSSNVLVPAPSGKYLAACRIVKSDGLWKTASDVYVRQYGLLATTPAPPTPGGSLPALDARADLQAKSGLPDSRAVGTYQNFIRSYLGGYLAWINASLGAPPEVSGVHATTIAQAAYDNFASGPADLENPPLVEFPTAGATENRYLHSRGLLVDHLTATARTAIVTAVAYCKKQGKSESECLLSQLPFTTVNATELARWSEEGGFLDVVDSGTLLASEVDEPFAGRTRGLSPVSSAAVKSSLWSSNSGLAFSHEIRGRVSPTELDLSDSQSFKVGGGSVTGFRVLVNGFQEPLGVLAVRRTAPSSPPSSDCLPAEGGYRCLLPAALPSYSVTLQFTGLDRPVASSSIGLADSVVVSCPVASGGARSTISWMPYKIFYPNMTVGINDNSATPATVTGNTATWSSTAAISYSDVIRVALPDRVKRCPVWTESYCQGGTVSATRWPDPTRPADNDKFTAEACSYYVR